MPNRLKLFFTYFGGKWRIARHYPEPLEETLIEPFAGAAGYALHYPEKKVHLYDLNPKICGVWDYLIKAKESEILALPTVISDLREMDLPQEAKWLIGFWLNKGHVMPCNVPGKWMRDGTHSSSFWGDVIKDRITSQLQYIRHWKISNESFESIANCSASWFIDPPYEIAGAAYTFNKIDYTYLAEYCKSRLGQVIVCEQEGASWLPFAPFRTIKTLEGKKGSKQSKEVIWTNVQSE